MADQSPIFTVVIDARTVSIRKVKPGGRGYAAAKKKSILRQRDAIEHFQHLKAAGKGFDGAFSFQILETAKTFAMLVLQAISQAVHANIDRVQVYDGSKDSTDA